ncbi:MAG: hypothetical protein J5I53_00895 [Bradyrhizobiaceae bacterium]|nr:hypothetical protein [Bradyrhizobiaceae bacterium]
MDVVKEILDVITSKVNIRKVFPDLKKKKSVQSPRTRYIDGLVNNLYTSDKQAAKDLYGVDTPDQRFRTLKSRTLEAVVSASLTLEFKQPEHSEYLSQYFKCARYFFCANILNRFASRAAGSAIADKAFSISKQYGFTDFSVQFCKMLGETAALWGQRKQAITYDKQLTELLAVQKAEFRADTLIDLFALETGVSQNTLEDIIKFGDEAIKETQAYYDLYGTHTLQLNLFRITIAVGEFRENSSDLLALCDEAIDYLHRHPQYLQPARLAEFKLRRVILLLITHQIDSAYLESYSLHDSFRNGGNNWFLALYLSSMTALRVSEYRRAADLLSIAQDHRQFKHLDETSKESFAILNAFVELADLLGLFRRKRPKKVFRLSRYINSLEEESKKKKTTNIAIIISHICLAIALDDYDEADEQADGLQDYIANYLQEPHFNRVRVFLDLLASFSRGNYYATTIEKSNRKLLPLLQETKNDHSPPTLFEYMQFEVLYDALLKHVRKHEAA